MVKASCSMVVCTCIPKPVFSESSQFHALSVKNKAVFENPSESRKGSFFLFQRSMNWAHSERFCDLVKRSGDHMRQLMKSALRIY